MLIPYEGSDANDFIGCRYLHLLSKLLFTFLNVLLSSPQKHRNVLETGVANGLSYVASVRLAALMLTSVSASEP